MKASIFVGVSVDGFMARRNGTFDFLDEGGNVPHGYDEFLATVDVLVIGRGTFDVVAKFAQWPYGEKRVVVLTRNPIDLSGLPSTVTHMQGEPAAIVAALDAEGFRHAYVDGGITIQQFLRAGLIQKLTITRVPVLIGDGIPLFGALLSDIRLRQVATRSYPSGLVQSEYEIIS